MDRYCRSLDWRGMARVGFDMVERISFRVVKESYGWSVRLGDGMMTPFRFRPLAVKHASGFVDALRRRGEFAEVIVEELGQPEVTPAAVRSDPSPLR